ncbi:MAG: hypothetical protein AAGC82_09560 [Pseudomonadota bacterium]
MISQVAGAAVRALVVVVVIATPSLLIPGTHPETTQIVTLIALFAAGLIYSEYAGTYPGLIEFRDAPPFNRVRIISVFVTLFLLSVVVSGGATSSTLTLVVNAAGFVVGKALEFPYSPVTLVLDNLGDDATMAIRVRVQIMAGIAALVGLVTLSIFAILIRMNHWPSRDQAFNVWINLPTFDPTTGGDVVARLTRDSRINIALGFALPFLLPMVFWVGTRHLGVSILHHPQSLVWTVMIWFFLPTSLFMRGMAMARIADMIEARRRRLTAGLTPEDGYQPV